MLLSITFTFYLTSLVDAFGLGSFIGSIVEWVRDRASDRRRDRAREGRVMGGKEYYEHCSDCSVRRIDG